MKLLEKQKQMKIGNMQKDDRVPAPIEAGPPNPADMPSDDENQLKRLKKTLNFEGVPDGPVFTPPRHVVTEPPPPPPPATPPRDVAEDAALPPEVPVEPAFVPPVNPHTDPFQERCPSWISGDEHDEDTEVGKALPNNRPVAAPLRVRDGEDEDSPVSRLKSTDIFHADLDCIFRTKGSFVYALTVLIENPKCFIYTSFEIYYRYIYIYINV